MKQASFEQNTVRVRLSRVPRAASPGVPPQALTVSQAELPQLLSQGGGGGRALTGGGEGGGRALTRRRRRRPPGPHRRRRRKRPPGPQRRRRRKRPPGSHRRRKRRPPGPHRERRRRPPGPSRGAMPGRRRSSLASGRGLFRSQGEWMVALPWVTHQNHLRSFPRHAQTCGPGGGGGQNTRAGPGARGRLEGSGWF